ncbi:MAG: PAS domain S-box protein [Phycisphaerae bacterium]|nr:PAS domain S-box protein [Saprospiraceae bacterium]
MKQRPDTNLADKPDPVNKPVPIVAIGASAGGLEAMTQLLKHLSPTTGMAFVYIQHLDPDHASMLSSILGRQTTMQVQEATHLMKVEANNVYVIPPNKSMESIDGVLTLDPREKRPTIPMPVDQFFISLSERQKEGSIAVVLSGTGSDGTVGLKAIKGAGGITIAQDYSAKFQGMPQSAINQEVVDLVLSPDKIADELERFSQQVPSIQQIILEEGPENELLDENLDLKSILQLLKNSSGVDFSHYKMNTIKRRITRRMLLNKVDTLSKYLDYLRQHATESGLLYNDLLINVTSFFRDPETLEYLKKTLLPDLLKSKSPNDSIRIWVPGCSTGEEAYSLAILFAEILGSKANQTAVQIFATDLSDMVISKARLGLYTASDLGNVSPQRLQRFFTKVNGQYRIAKPIRDRCVFAPHNLFKDPPFPRLDLISCCNLFIYLSPLLQKKIVATFHYSLRPNGHLILGKSESIGTSLIFTQLNRKYKIYTRKNTVSSLAISEMNRRLPQMELTDRSISQKPAYKPATPENTLEKTVDELLLQQFVPPTVVVNQEMEILQFRGFTGLFLEPASGKATLNLLKMARPELVFELRNAVHKCGKTGQPIKKTGLPMRVKDKDYLVCIDIVPLKSEGEERLFLVLFTEQVIASSTESQTNKTRTKQIAQLDAELAALREDMRSITEEQETSNEELQSANEEIVASNEELQSLNEEMETSKEELEATNEELMATNQELQVRNLQLSETEEFSEAIFDTIRESVVVLDQDLRVKLANKTFYNTYQVTEKETVGRLIYALGNRQWDIPKLRTLLEEILLTKDHFYGFEVVHSFPNIGEKIMVLNAHKLVQRMNQEDLIVLAIEDMTANRRALQLEVFEAMANNASVMIWVADSDKNCTFFNKTWLEFTGRTVEQESGQGWVESVHYDDSALYLDSYSASFEARNPFQLEYRLRRKDGEYRWMMEMGKPVFSLLGEFKGYIGYGTDIHSQKMLNEELDRRVKERTQELVEVNLLLERSNEELQNFAFVASHDLQEPLRKILTFSDRLQKRQKDKLDEEAGEYLDAMDRSAQRMSRLIDDLLNFARITRQEKTFTPVQLNDIIHSNLQDFDLAITQKNAVITIGVLPTIEAISLQMKQLFHNLISNSLKFSMANNPPYITISSQIPTAEDIRKYVNAIDPKAYTEIIVRDNGIGFEPEFADKIFAIFQRLHGKKEYEGTGIGLALCRAVVKNHGGAIYAISEKGNGTAFHIILPLKQP